MILLLYLCFYLIYHHCLSLSYLTARFVFPYGRSDVHFLIFLFQFRFFGPYSVSAHSRPLGRVNH
jgi:hypothetical protein